VDGVEKPPCSDDIKYYSTLLYYNGSPTGNCQVGSIGNIQTIRSFPKESMLKVLKELYKATMKPMWLLDVRAEHYDYIIDLLGKDNINIETKYKSTNNSNMVLTLYRTKNLINITV
jgi:hypothetical protein